MVNLRKLKVKLINLNCYATEEQDFDDVFIVLDGKKIWPEKKRQQGVRIGSTPLNIEIENLDPGTKLDLEIWDYDVISSNDLMGHIPIYVDEPGGPYTTDMLPDPEEAKIAKYMIEWEIDFNDPD